MAFVQGNLPAPPVKYSFALNNFSGGLNNNASDQLIGDNQASDILNMDFTDEGLMEKRKGIGKYSTTDYGASIISIDKVKFADEDYKLIVMTDKTVWCDDVKIADVNANPFGVQYIDKYYFVDGEKIRAYGKFPQTTDASTYIKLTGTPTANKIVMELVEPPSGFTPLTTTHTTGVWQYDYTNKKMWYEPCQNELDDTFKGKNTIPKKPRIVKVHGDRLFISNEDKNKGEMLISDIQNGLYYPAGLPLQLPPNGEEITGIEVFMDTVVVFRKYDVNVVYGNTNRTGLDDVFLMKNVNIHTGTSASRSICKVHNYLYFLGTDGIIYSMHTTRTDVTQLATAVMSNSLDLFKYPIELKQEDIKKCYGLFHDNKYYLTLPDKTLVYSYRFRAWTMFSSQQSSAFSLGEFNDKMVIGGNDNYLYEFKELYHDEMFPIVAYWSSKRFNYGEPSRYKQFKEMFVVGHVYADYKSDINIRYEIDYVDIKQTAQIVNKISTWGKALFGDRFISRNISPSLPINIGQRGRVIRYIIGNGLKVDHVVADNTERDALTRVAGMIVFVKSDNKIYSYNLEVFTELQQEEIYQPLKIYEINGEYQRRGKR